MDSLTPSQYAELEAYLSIEPPVEQLVESLNKSVAVIGFQILQALAGQDLGDDLKESIMRMAFTDEEIRESRQAAALSPSQTVNLLRAGGGLG